MNISIIIGIVIAAILITVIFSAYPLCRRKCPYDKILAVYAKGKGKNGTARLIRCIHGGSTFVMPLLQGYAFLDLTPISINVDMVAPSKEGIVMHIPTKFTVCVSIRPAEMRIAAVRLLGKSMGEIEELARGVINEEMSSVIASMSIEKIHTDRDEFLDKLSNRIENELNKIGVRLINVNVTDITDESGYILALDREAVLKAIREAEAKVAAAEKQAEREQRKSNRFGNDLNDIAI